MKHGLNTDGRGPGITYPCLIGVSSVARFFSLCLCASVVNSDAPKAQWKLVWADEFDGKDIDRAKWDFDLGNGFYNYDANTWIAGWGNGELQYYTREPDNAFVK